MLLHCVCISVATPIKDKVTTRRLLAEKYAALSKKHQEELPENTPSLEMIVNHKMPAPFTTQPTKEQIDALTQGGKGIIFTSYCGSNP